MDEVIRRARAGDRDALAHLWRSYQHLLLRYFRGKGMAEPEDLASIVWIEVAPGSADSTATRPTSAAGCSRSQRAVASTTSAPGAAGRGAWSASNSCS
jgi:hypothetical protein